MTDWKELRSRFTDTAVDSLRQQLAGAGLYSTTANVFASTAHISVAEARDLLDAVVATGELERHNQRTCGACEFDLYGIDANRVCPNCGIHFVDREPVTAENYLRIGVPPRAIPWFLVVHGMNTRGDWQEALTWLIGRSYSHMVPVAIYKYGKIQPGVLIGFRQRQLRRKLAVKMKALAAESAAAGLEGYPDVIAHSFGTWLIANALLNDSSLKIGRLILLGSIVPPNFPWSTIVERRQVEHILNHGGTHDAWVPAAHYVIPTSGPGGTRGFPPPVVNIPAVGLGHSDYFRPEWRMKLLFESVWQPFLSWNVPHIASERQPPRPWSPSCWFIQKAGWLFAVAVFVLVLFASLAVLVLGLRECWRLI